MKNKTDEVLREVITQVMLLHCEYPDHRHIPIVKLASVSIDLTNAIMLLTSAREKLDKLSKERLI